MKNGGHTKIDTAGWCVTQASGVDALVQASDAKLP